MAEFDVYVAKEDFKFNCAHFIAFDGFRERLHGHNYQVSVRMVGSKTIGHDGYLIDFGDVKKTVRALCKKINEYFICPTQSPNLKITEEGAQLCLECDDGSKFSFPKSDCAMLPLKHSSAEELAHYFWCNIIRTVGFEKLSTRGIRALEVGVAEAVNQMATYRCPIPPTLEELEAVLAAPVNFTPRPCLQEE